VLDTDRRESAQFADVVLPIATYAESDGTFTNHLGRVQRFHASVAPPGEARPGWQALAELVSLVTGEPRAENAEAVFGALATASAPFRALSWAALGGEGVQTDPTAR
jgi:predicted molibdopterin-dependent oxidoreductase YjgC